MKGRISPELRRYILARDEGCVLALYNPEHICRDIWGEPHRANDLDKMTLEHVKDDLMMGRRAPSDPAHLVALCAFYNVRVPSKEMRAIFREHLRLVEVPT